MTAQENMFCPSSPEETICRLHIEVQTRVVEGTCFVALLSGPDASMPLWAHAPPAGLCNHRALDIKILSPTKTPLVRSKYMCTYMHICRNTHYLYIAHTLAICITNHNGGAHALTSLLALVPTIVIISKWVIHRKCASGIETMHMANMRATWR